MSFGGGSGTTTQGETFVDPAQRPFLQQMRSQAQTLQQQLQPGLNQFAQTQLGGLFQQGLGQNQVQQNLQQAVLTDPFQQQQLSALGNFSNRNALQGQIGNLGQNLGQFFNEQLLPGIDRTTQLEGQGIGTGRNAVARGQATRDTLNAFSRGAADLEAQFGQQQIGAAVAGLQGAQQQQALAADIGQGFLGNLAGLGNLGLSQFTAPFAGLNNLAGIIGPPTVLSFDKSKSTEIRGPGFFT